MVSGMPRRKTSLPQPSEGFLESRALNGLEFWANDGLASRDIKGRHFRGIQGGRQEKNIQTEED